MNNGLSTGVTASWALAGLAFAQCEPEWLSRPEQGWIGVGGTVRAIAVHDDGEGAAVFVGGSFELAGRSTARGVARWNGAEWRALGPGLSSASGSAGGVLALTSHGDELVAGGVFVAAGTTPTKYIARWNGQEWRSLGAGMSHRVLSLASFQGDLIAGGAFTEAGGVGALRIARWDGAAWHALGNGVSGWVLALAVYEGQLIVGQRYASTSQPLVEIMRWDGDRWSSLPGGVTGLYPEVRSLCVYNGDLIVGGQFAGAGGIGTRCVARWDGSAWHGLGTGIAGTGAVDVVAAADDRLYVGGSFSAGPGRYIQSWDGVDWEPMASGTNSDVFALAGAGTEVIVGGAFTLADERSVNYCARWDGREWHALNPGFNGPPKSMMVHDGELIIGGVFTIAGGVPTSAVARFDGANWQGIGPGLGAMTVEAIRFYDGELVAGGDSAGGNIKRWDGSFWTPLGGGVSHQVHALSEYQGDLIVGGGMTSAGPVPASRIARWDGVSWHALGIGIHQGPINVSGTTSVVYALGHHGGELIAVGKFIGAGGVAAMNIARWDGAAWSPLAGGLGSPDANSYVLSIAEFRGDLVAAGRDLSIGSGPFVNVARWDGTAWQPIGGAANSAVTLVKVLRDELIAGGSFGMIGGVPANAIARWNGVAWQGFGAGIGGPPPNFGPYLHSISDVAVFNDEMVVGGYFTTSGGRVTAFWARWGCADCYPDCSGDGQLTAADFGCFQTRFVSGDPYADCNADGTLSVSDFGCFQTRYLTECN